MIAIGSRLLILSACMLLPPLSFAQTRAATALDRAHSAHGGKWRSSEITDWVCEGTIVYFTTEGPKHEFPVVLRRKGRDKLQLVVTQPTGEMSYGTDGSGSWQTAGSNSFLQGGRPTV